MNRIVLLLIVAACSKSTVTEPAKPDDWKCFERDPKEPALPQGDVTHTRQRVVDGGIAIESVNNQAGRGGATRLVFKPAGDHLEAVLGGVVVTAKLLKPDGSHWTLSYQDPASGLQFTEENVIANGILTVISTDPGEGGPIKTPVRYLPASCSVVVAELAKYPP